ncbi:MAG: hypothetical protein ACLQHK_01065 [Gallionellaceae bacterium]
MNDNKTISYEMKFSSSVEEYAYDLERYAGLGTAIPPAIEQWWRVAAPAAGALYA